ncbi:hypothetical protein CVT25_015449 [Psilocybe cyanescens]|uniref:EF-hand domain-containing protein n=1 Tax=Psilocybe cyanescens TaxID=93625 RepID=A0A409WHJ5_PSICY|nr:hypothetical protein CVT25_015449 [Psilocybe cyanescens]
MKVVVLNRCSRPSTHSRGDTDVIRKQSAASHAQHLSPINPDGVRNFKMVLLEAGPANGFLDGQKVMDSFMRQIYPMTSRKLSSSSVLSTVQQDMQLIYDRLCRRLIDQNARGSLDFWEFSLGMYQIHALQSCLISSVPDSFPRKLFNRFLDLQPGDSKHSSTYSSSSSSHSTYTSHS